MSTLKPIDRLRAAGREVLELEPASEAHGVAAERHVQDLGDGVWRVGLEVISTGESTRTDRLLAVQGRLLDAPRRWSGFVSAWGAEFAPAGGDCDEPLVLRSTAGRSSHGAHPWLGVETDGGAVVVSVAWSGNWVIRLRPDGTLEAGVDGAVADLAAGERLTAPSVLIAAGPDLETASTALATAVGRALVPRSPASDALPTEWNHWWPYEDAKIDEAVFLANAREAGALGFAVSVLDAGWFGPSDAGSAWTDHRGDWALVNRERFPAGLRDLADRTRAGGTRFGVWLEAEAVGAASALRVEHPELLALRTGPQDVHLDAGVSHDPEDPSFLGYVCLGSPPGRRFVAESLARLVAETGATWVKLDFNVDPGAGCDRVDHGHGAGDGLLRHYLGLYDVLDRFRDAHPDVVLEACSSGGLRLDLGLAEHVHCMFLSDPDWTEHHLQVLWGASRMLPASAMLHWSWSSWRGEHPDQQPDPATLSPAAFAATLRAAMLHRFGVSLRLVDLPGPLRDVLKDELARYHDLLRPFVLHGRLRRLTGQPLRHGAGERVPAFQLDLEDEHLAAGFVLPGGSTPAAQRFVDLIADRTYRVRSADDPTGAFVADGRSLTTSGVPLSPGALSWLLVAEP